MCLASYVNASISFICMLGITSAEPHASRVRSPTDVTNNKFLIKYSVFQIMNVKKNKTIYLTKDLA